MAWPTTSVSTTNLDNDADSPVLARPDIKQMADNVNDIKDALLDEDDMSSNSSTSIASQQSIKAYVDKQGKRNMAVFDVVNDYGAAGDDSTDDLTEIQAAIDAAEAAGGGIVWFPDLIYRVSSALIVDTDNVILLGAGKGAVIKTTNTAIDILQLKADCLVQNIALTCFSVPTAGDAIQVQDDAAVVLRDVKIDNTFQGVYVYECSSCVFDNVEINQLHGAVGLLFAGGSGDIAKKIYGQNIRISQPYHTALTAHSQFKSWAATTAFTAGDVVVSSGNIYQCSTGGTSGGTTPSGKGSSNAADAFTTEITDGTAGWKYIGSSSLKLIRVNTYVEDLALNALYLEGGAYGLYVESTSGGASDVPTRVNFESVSVTQAYYENITVTAGKEISIDGFSNTYCWQGKGVNASGTNFDHFSLLNGKISNCYEEGLYLAGVSDARVSCAVGNNSESGSASFSGIRVGATTERFFIVNTTSGDVTGGTNNQAYGILVDEDASIDNYIIRGCILQDNVTGSIDDNSLASTTSVGDNI
jgi:hypothetical protein